MADKKIQNVTVNADSVFEWEKGAGATFVLNELKGHGDKTMVATLDANTVLVLTGEGIQPQEHTKRAPAKNGDKPHFQTSGFPLPDDPKFTPTLKIKTDKPLLIDIGNKPHLVAFRVDSDSTQEALVKPPLPFNLTKTNVELNTTIPRTILVNPKKPAPPAKPIPIGYTISAGAKVDERGTDRVFSYNNSEGRPVSVAVERSTANNQSGAAITFVDTYTLSASDTNNQAITRLASMEIKALTQIEELLNNPARHKNENPKTREQKLYAYGVPRFSKAPDRLQNVKVIAPVGLVINPKSGLAETLPVKTYTAPSHHINKEQRPTQKPSQTPVPGSAQTPASADKNSTLSDAAKTAISEAAEAVIALGEMSGRRTFINAHADPKNASLDLKGAFDGRDGKPGLIKAARDMSSNPTVDNIKKFNIELDNTIDVASHRNEPNGKKLQNSLSEIKAKIEVVNQEKAKAAADELNPAKYAMGKASEADSQSANVRGKGGSIVLS